MRDNESGYITVETAGAFILFVLLVSSILSLVNIVTLQTRVHYALTQAANTVSVYAYALEVTGAAGRLRAIDEGASVVRREAAGFRSDIGAVYDSIKSLSLRGAAAHGEAAVTRVLGWGEDIADDPVSMARTLLDYGLSTGGSHIFGHLVRPLVGRYLSNGTMTGDEYLRSVNVIDGLDGLEFGGISMSEPGSVLIDSNGDVRLIVHYEIEYRFGALPLPFRPVLSVTQTASTKAWLGGRGEGYW